jgi:hypothetical protein
MAAGYDLAGGHDGNYYAGSHAQLTTTIADGMTHAHPLPIFDA